MLELARLFKDEPCIERWRLLQLFSTGLGEFLLNYDEVRGAANPAEVVLDFLEATYSAAADAAGWDRAALDRVDAIGAAAVRLGDSTRP